MKFVVTLEATASKDVEVEAETPQDAVVKANELVKKLTAPARAEGVESKEASWTVVGYCEGCKAPIVLKHLGLGHFEGDEYDFDDEGCYTCAACLACKDGKA